MKTITFTCETITPMFLGGANPNEVELRPPSIKGALRFWWRAMHGDWDLDKLKTEEAKLFGGTEPLHYMENGKKVEFKPSRSKVQINVIDKGIKKSNKEDKYNLRYPSQWDGPEWYSANRRRADIFKYLAYGTYDFHKGYKDFIRQDSKFSIEIRCKNSIEDSNIILPMKALSTFGGLGSRSRNGFGSFRITHINEMPTNYLSISQMKNGKIDNPKYSAFSNGMKLFKTELQDTWNLALGKLGEAYRRARLELDSNKYKFDKRVYIAEPIQQARRENVLDRHPKPFFMNVRKEDKGFRGYLLYLPSYYVVEVKDKIKLKNSRIFVFDTKGIDIRKMNNMDKADRNFKTVCNEFLENMEKQLTEVGK